MRCLALMFLVFLGISSQAQVLKFNCVAPEALHLNRFALTAQVELTLDEDALDMYRFENLSFEAQTTKRGQAMSPETKTVEGLAGDVRVVPAGNTREPYFFLRVIDKERDLKMKFAIDFPRPLNSSLLIDGFMYRATCQSVQ